MGALQSNHCRATAAVCSKLGLECHLLLRGESLENEGNLFLNYILGANIHLITEDSEFESEALNLYNKLRESNKNPYIIPMGASNRIGSYGYIEAFNEILEQEKTLGINFDLISMAVGSGGTYSGIWYGNYKNITGKRVLGISVSKVKEEFTKKIIEILKDMDNGISDFETIEINDSYVGEGYGRSTDTELKFYMEIAKEEGMVLDPCYTGKAFKGLIEEIEKGNIKEKNILFIHTGGFMGWTKAQRDKIIEIIRERR